MKQILASHPALDIDCFRSQPLHAWMRFESELNDGSPSGFGINSRILREYRPDAQEFDLPVFLIFKPEDAIRNSSSCALRKVLNQSSDATPLFVHPQFIDRLSGHQKLKNCTITHLKARASSSVRTVWVLESGTPLAFVKMHFPATIGRFRRDMRLYGWLASLENSKLLAFSLANSNLLPPDTFAILRETGGTFLEGDGITEGFGHIEREIIPFPPRTDAAKCPIIPFFSLWASEAKVGAKNTLLAKIILSTGITYEQLISLLLVPLLDGYNHSAIKVGLIPECNAQNILWEVDPSMKHCRVVHRDMMGFFKDITVGLAKDQDSFSSITYHTIGSEHCSDTKLRRSFAFDFKLSKYVIDPLVSIMSAVYDRSRLSIQSDIANISKCIIKWPPNYFPDDNMAYGYPNKRSVGRSSYVCIGNPLYR